MIVWLEGLLVRLVRLVGRDERWTSLQTNDMCHDFQAQALGLLALH